MAHSLEESLKICLLILDDDPDSTRNPLRRKLTLSDFDHLTSDLMVYIVSQLISRFDENFTLDEKYQALSDLDQMGIMTTSVTYESSIDRVYRAAINFFPENSNTLELSVFFAPQYDIKRAKAVIQWITSFIFYIENTVEERFQQEWDSLHKENEEKMKLFNEIEDLKTEIVSCIQKNENMKDMKPKLVQELRDLETQILKEQADLAKWEQTANKEKKNYDHYAAEVAKLESKLEALNIEKELIEQQIVASAPEVVQDHWKESDKLKEELRIREALGVQIKEAGNKEQFLNNIIEKSGAAVRRFESLIITIQGLNENLAHLAKTKSTCQDKCKDIDQTKRLVLENEDEEQRLKTEFKNRANSNIAELQTLDIKAAEEQKKFENASLRIQQLQDRMANIEQEIYDTEEECTELNEEIKACRDFVELEVPRRMEAVKTISDKIKNKQREFLLFLDIVEDDVSYM